MIDFSLTDKQKLIQQAAKEFAEKELLPGVIDRDISEEFPIECFKKLGDKGLIGIQYPKKYGGQDGDFISYVLAIEELCKIDSSFGIAYSISTTGFAGAIMDYANEEQKMHCLPSICKGEGIGCFALTEPDAGSDAGSAKTTAVRNGDNFIINGTKHFITNGAIADYCFLVANTDLSKGHKGLTAFLVDLKTTPGVRIDHVENKCGIRSAKVTELVFENCVIPADRMIGEEGRGFNYALGILNAGRIGVAAQALGLAQSAFDIARDYMKVRKQFGKPICKNQYLAFKMADLESEIDMARLMLYKATWELQNGLPYAVSAAKAKLVCSNVAMKVTTECIQNMGGCGYMREQHVERMFRDAKITQIYEGTNEIQRLVISRDIFK